MTVIVQIDERRFQHVDDVQWEALAYLGLRGKVTLGPGEDHSPRILHDLVSRCCAMRLCDADLHDKSLRLSSLGERALRHRMKIIAAALSSKAIERTKDLVHWLVAPSMRVDKELAKHGLVRCSTAGDLTYRCELGLMFARCEVRP